MVNFFLIKVCLVLKSTKCQSISKKILNSPKNRTKLTSGMFSIKFLGPVKFSVLFPSKFLACDSLKNYDKNMENFTGFPKYDAKHWANVKVIMDVPVAIKKTGKKE